MENRKINSSIIKKGIIILVCVLVVAYIGTAIYFKNHFYLGSKINGISVSGMTVEEVEDVFKTKFQEYSLTLEERNNLQETITSEDISLTYDSYGKIQEFKDNQSSLGWIFGIFKSKTTELTDLITYDEEKLNDKLNHLQGVVSKDVVAPKSASVKFEGDNIEVIEEVQGNKINMDALKSAVKDAIFNSEEVLNLDEKECYEKPKFISTDNEVQTAKDLFEKYSSSSITYIFGNNSETLDGETISKWLSTDEDLNVIVDESQAKKYVLSLANKYNTIGLPRDFSTSYGSVVRINKGDYGWRINISAETSQLINDIKEGQTITKEPVYAQKAAKRGSNDIGNTYVEVNLTKQHVLFYKNGSLVIEGDVVTGNESAGTGTPDGVYMLKYIEKDATLKGEDYESKVKYWMPFNGGIGFHDASWRDTFGGQIYLTNGSHGCVNCPEELAKTIFENIEPGTPVVCYFEAQ